VIEKARILTTSDVLKCAVRLGSIRMAAIINNNPERQRDS
jgi:hypothetical protein